MRLETRGGGSATLWTMPWRLLEPACCLLGTEVVSPHLVKPVNVV